MLYIPYNKKIDPLEYINYLCDKRLPITIQEHFQNQRINGTRQTPNIYDDISSLCKIFSILDNYDIWYVSCSDLAHYLESYDKTKLDFINDKQFSIKYKGEWDYMFLSFISDYREIKHETNGEIIKGIQKNNKWIYNNLKEGIYKVL